jgi:hypothetical protein
MQQCHVLVRVCRNICLNTSIYGTFHYNRVYGYEKRRQVQSTCAWDVSSAASVHACVHKLWGLAPDGNNESEPWARTRCIGWAFEQTNERIEFHCARVYYVASVCHMSQRWLTLYGYLVVILVVTMVFMLVVKCLRVYMRCTVQSLRLMSCSFSFNLLNFVLC